MNNRYVVIALFEFLNSSPLVFNEFVCCTDSCQEAFYALDNYDCEKVIASEYKMEIEKINTRKEFGIKTGTKKGYYEEQRKYIFRLVDKEEWYNVKVTLTIFEA